MKIAAIKVGDVIEMSGRYIVNPITSDTLVMNGQAMDRELVVGQRGVMLSLPDTEGEPLGPFVVSHVESDLAHLTPEATWNRLQQ